MKRGIILLLIILTLPSILAVELSISKESYQPQELLQAQITGNFISLTKDNIFIYKDNKAHPEPVIKDLTKLGNTYYFYAILSNQEGNFSFKIENIEYLQRGKLISEPIIKDFTIIYKNTSDLSINPGHFSIFNQDKITLKITSLYKNIDLTAIFDATEQSHELSLIESTEETITFAIPETMPQESSIKVGDYLIPVFNFQKTPVIKTQEIIFIPEVLKGTVVQDHAYFFTVVLKNQDNKSIENIKITNNLDAIITPREIPSIGPNSIKVINITFSVLNTSKTSGEIIAETKDRDFILPVLFEKTDSKENETLPPDITISSEDKSTTTASTSTSYSCSDYKDGKICLETEICEGKTEPSLQGTCCLGKCTAPKSTNYFYYIGIILLIIIIAAAIFFFWKMRKKQGLRSPEDILKERSAKFKERMEAKDNQEVSEKLDKV